MESTWLGTVFRSLSFVIFAPLIFAAEANIVDPIFLFPPQLSSRTPEQYVPVANYNSIVQALVPGNVLGFQDGARFEFVDFIGHGGTTHVLRVKATTGEHAGKSMALRIPISDLTLHQGQNWYGTMLEEATRYELNLTFSHFVVATLKHAELFSKTGIGPKYYGGLPGEYAAFEIVGRKFALEEYLEGQIKFSPEADSAVRAALARFEKRTAGINGIQDIANPGQVLFNGTEFILVDWYGVRMVEGDLNPWGFLTSGLSGNVLYSDGMISQGLVATVLADLRMKGTQAGVPLTPEQISRRAWQDELTKYLKGEFAAARLDMLEEGVNPLTGKAPTSVHSYWERNFGIWRKVYSEMQRTRRARNCKRMLLPEIFQKSFSEEKTRASAP